MTDDRMALIELIEKGADADLVRELLAFAADRMMELEIEAKTGAPAGTRSPDRLNHRNGYRERGWEAAVLEATYQDHVQGWDHFLPRLVSYAATLDPCS